MYYTRYELHARMNVYYAAGSVSTAFGGVSCFSSFINGEGPN